MTFSVSTHPLEIPVNYPVGVEVFQALSDVIQLTKGVRASLEIGGGEHTRPSRFFLGWVVRYSVRPRPGIQAETSWGGSRVAPRKGAMFLCLKCFHVTATSKNLCKDCFEMGTQERNM